MNLKKLFISLFLVLIIFVQKIYADDAVNSARDIKNKFENAVVSIKITIKQKMAIQGREVNTNESRSEIIGTVIDNSGLIVTSLIATEPTVFYNKIMKNRGGPQASHMKWESEVSDIKIRFNDGQEKEGKILLRDKDLDLVFIQPAEKYSASSSVNLKEAGEVRILDQIVILSRLGKIASWTPTMTLDRIEAVIQKPRPFYISRTKDYFGAPVFSLDGKFAGIYVLRSTESDSDIISSIFSGPGAAGFIPIILPASDIAETVKQILETPAQEKSQ
ncbi:MAG: hypothetical protein AB1498_12250 [bacterium]